MDVTGFSDRKYPPALLEALGHAQELGLIGGGSLAQHLQHAEGFRSVVDTRSGAEPSLVLDLGSGGGIPGLVLASLWEGSRLVLLDAMRRRCEALRQAVGDCGWQNRVTVLHARAEDAGRAAEWRGKFDVVVARAFGPPPVVAECAAPFLKAGGILVVSEPPSGHKTEAASSSAVRWPTESLKELGLWPEGRSDPAEGYGYQVLLQLTVCPERFPRRSGLAGKRPLYRVSSEHRP